MGNSDHSRQNLFFILLPMIGVLLGSMIPSMTTWMIEGRKADIDRNLLITTYYDYLTSIGVTNELNQNKNLHSSALSRIALYGNKRVLREIANKPPGGKNKESKEWEVFVSRLVNAMRQDVIDTHEFEDNRCLIYVLFPKETQDDNEGFDPVPYC